MMPSDKVNDMNEFNRLLLVPSFLESSAATVVQAVWSYDTCTVLSTWSNRTKRTEIEWTIMDMLVRNMRFPIAPQ